MPSVSGSAFASNQTFTPVGNLVNVPIVLQNTTTGVGIGVLTNSSGLFTFNNVPSGTYRLVEAWGFSGAVTTPADFNNATVIPIPTGVDPPITQASVVPAGATYLASVTANTQTITVSTSNITNVRVVDSYYREAPLPVNDLTLIGENIFTNGAFGTYGTLPAGTPTQSWPATAPYSFITGLTYKNDGSLGFNEYTVSNIMNFFNWRCDHTSGDETGRACFINGGSVGAVYYSETVSVLPNTFYQLSNWIQNATGAAPPIVGYRVLTPTGAVVASANVTIGAPLTPAIWREVGTLFNSGNNTSLTIRFTSQQSAFDGNDFVVDDMSLIQVTVDNIVEAQKFTSKTNARVGEIIDYTVVLRNTGASTITDMVFVDTVPNGTTFNTGTMRVNGTTIASANPANFRFTTPPLPLVRNGVITVNYRVTINTLPNPNPIPNSATANYAFAPIAGGVTIPVVATSNIVNTQVVNPTLASVKTTSQTNATIGDIITYTVVAANTGNTTLANIVFRDTIPTGTTFVANSVVIDNVQQTGANPSPPNGIVIGTLPVGASTTIAFKVTVTSIPTPNPFVNVGTFGYDFLSGTIVAGSESQNTNTVSTRVNAAILSATKQSIPFANVGSIVTYTIPIINTGNTIANNIKIIDTIPNGTSYVSGSLTQDGTAVPGSLDPPGVTLPNGVGPNGITTITFKVTITSIPSPNPIPNSGNISYQYTSDPSVPNGSIGNTNTNLVTTQVNNANLSIGKSVDKSFAAVGDMLNYTLIIPNTGNVTANNVVIIDTIPAGAAFVPGSVFVNGVADAADLRPPNRLELSSIPAGSVVTVTFQAQVNSTIPSINPLPNQATVGYNYVVNPITGAVTSSGGSNSNIVATTIISPVIRAVKSVDLTSGYVDDPLLYTIVVSNTGNTTATNMKFIDTIPNATALVANSVTVNGVTLSGSSIAPPDGITLPDIGINQTATVTFQVTVSTLPNPNPTTNVGSVNYSYINDPSQGARSNTSNTNVVSTFIYPTTNPFKAVDQQFASVGDVLTYIIGWDERQNVTDNNVTFVDTIPNGLTFVPNSVIVNGVSQPAVTITPPSGFNFGTLAPLQSVTVSYKVLVNTIPVPNPIPNDYTVLYTNTISAGLQSEVSNLVTTQVNVSTVQNVVKTVNKPFAAVGETLTYTISFNNVGNTTLSKLIFIDTVPSGTAIVPNSTTINTVTILGDDPTPPTGINLGTVPLGVSTVTFQVTVVSIPASKDIPNIGTFNFSYVVDPVTGLETSGTVNTNIAVTTLSFANVQAVKVVDKAISNIPSSLTYTITLANTGITTANNVIFSDTLPTGANFLNGSLLINNVANSGNPNPPGVTLPDIAPGAIVTVSYRVTVSSIPNPNPVMNTGTVNYSYVLNPITAATLPGSGNTNTVSTQIVNASLSGISKSADKTFATCGDEITYTIVIPNTGNTAAQNVIINDTVPNGTVFVNNSVTVNGSSTTDTPSSITVGTVNAGVTATVTFKVKVIC